MPERPSSLNAFVLEDPPCGISPIFSHNSLPFRPFQHLQLIMDEWDAFSLAAAHLFFLTFAHFLFFFSVSPSFLPPSFSFIPLSLSQQTSHFCLSAKFVQRRCDRRQEMLPFLRRVMFSSSVFSSAFSLLSFYCSNLAFSVHSVFSFWPLLRRKYEKKTMEYKKKPSCF